MQKHCIRRTDNQISKETNFSSNLLQLFYISHKNYGKLTKSPEDIAFLGAQRDGRKCCIPGIDTTLAKKKLSQILEKRKM